MELESPKYVIDANIFMQAARTYYSFDIAPRFWEALVEYGNDNKIVSIDKVFQEIKLGDDKLKEWAINDFKFFDTTQTMEIIKCFGELSQWAESQTHYTRAAKDEFMDTLNADAWVIAFAKVYNCTVVTMELPRLGRKRVIPIPNACKAFDVEYCDTFQMLNDFDFSF